MVAVDVTTEPEFRAGTPRVLFRGGGFWGTVPVRSHDLSTDGRRFLMVRWETPMPEDVTELQVVLNWHEELKRRVPVE
jgi:hypothetical protein